MDKESGKLGDRLSGFGKEPGESVWQSLEKKLEVRRRRKRRRAIGLLVLSAGLLLLSAGIWQALLQQATTPGAAVSLNQKPGAYPEHGALAPGTASRDASRFSRVEEEETPKPTTQTAEGKRRTETASPSHTPGTTETTVQETPVAAPFLKESNRIRTRRPERSADRFQPAIALGRPSRKKGRKIHTDAGRTASGQPQHAAPGNHALAAATRPHPAPETGQLVYNAPEMAEAAAADPSKEQNNPEETARSGQADLVPADSLNPAAEPVKPTEETINVKGENLRDPEKGRWVKEISVSFRNPVAGTLFINQTEGEPRITEPANGKFLGRIMVGADFGIQKNLLRWLAVQGSSGLFFQRDYLGFSRNAARETRVLFQGNRMVFLKETENRSGYTQTLRLGGQAGLGLVFLPGNRLPEIRVRAGGLFSLAGENRYSWDGKVSDKRSGLAFSGLYIQVSAVRHFSFAGSDCWVEPQFLLLPDPSFRYNGGIARQVHYFGIGLGCRLPQK